MNRNQIWVLVKCLWDFFGKCYKPAFLQKRITLWSSVCLRNATKITRDPTRVPSALVSSGWRLNRWHKAEFQRFQACLALFYFHILIRTEWILLPVSHDKTQSKHLAWYCLSWPIFHWYQIYSGQRLLCYTFKTWVRRDAGKSWEHCPLLQVSSFFHLQVWVPLGDALRHGLWEGCLLMLSERAFSA